MLLLSLSLLLHEALRGFHATFVRIAIITLVNTLVVVALAVVVFAAVAAAGGGGGGVAAVGVVVVVAAAATVDVGWVDAVGLGLSESHSKEVLVA